MARCPFARWVPADRKTGPHTGGPDKVVHHKTVADSENARALFGNTGSWPHFTVGNEIQQHYDTAVYSRALRNSSGGVQTNSDGAIQIELRGRPGETAQPNWLENLARLLAWIEETHHIPHAWPNGRPKKATADGRDPGGHNRDAHTWDTQGGHYGHSNVPENTHWDPAYTDVEWDYINRRPLFTVEQEDDDMNDELRKRLDKIDTDNREILRRLGNQGMDHGREKRRLGIGDQQDWNTVTPIIDEIVERVGAVVKEP